MARYFGKQITRDPLNTDKPMGCGEIFPGCGETFRDFPATYKLCRQIVIRIKTCVVWIGYRRAQECVCVSRFAGLKDFR